MTLHCKTCGKRLHRTYGERWLAREERLAPRLYKEPSLQRRLESIRAQYERFRGRYGYHGDNCFCTGKCGYRYGVWAARAASAKVQLADSAHVAELLP